MPGYMSEAFSSFTVLSLQEESEEKQSKSYYLIICCVACCVLTPKMSENAERRARSGRGSGMEYVPAECCRLIFAESGKEPNCPLSSVTEVVKYTLEPGNA